MSPIRTHRGRASQAMAVSLVLSAPVALLGCGAPYFVTGRLTPAGEVVTFTPAPTTVVLGAGSLTDDVRAAIARALDARGYVVETSEPTRVVARLASRGLELRIAIDFDTTRAVMTYLDSSGLALESPTSSRRYDRWMRQLSDTVLAEIGRPERERQEALAQAEEAQARREREEREAADRRQREVLAAQQAQLDRESYERLERDRLAAARAQAEADAADARARAAEAQARPRVSIGTYASVDRLGFDATNARRARGVIQVGAGFHEQHARRAVAGGPESQGSMGFPDACPGWFAASAQHTLVLTSDVPYLRIEAPSDGDATLAIVSPEGDVWCDDDSAGQLTPRVDGWFPAGVYHVFVGSYRPGERAQYELALYEQGAPAYSAAGLAAPPPDPTACRQLLLASGRSAADLHFCDGAEPSCADTLLRTGRPASELTYCRAVEPTCADVLLRSGRPAVGLQYCRGVEPQCASTLLQSGQAAEHLVQCTR